MLKTKEIWAMLQKILIFKQSVQISKNYFDGPTKLFSFPAKDLYPGKGMHKMV